MTRRTRALLLAALAATIVAALVASLAPGSAPERKKPAPPGETPRPPKADRDRDKLSDDLEARLGRLSPDDRLSVIVALSGEPTSRRIRSVQAKIGRFTVTHRLSIIDAFAARVTKRQALALSRLSDVRRVEANSRVRALNDSAQASFGVTKARIDAPSLDGSADGNVAAYSSGDLVAAVIDTGIDASHRDLDEGKVLAFATCLTGTGTCVPSAPFDDGIHGTHVAATIAGEGDARPDGRYKGVAPGAALVGVKALNAAGVGFTADVVAGTEWVIDRHAQLGIEAINFSLGSEGDCSDGADALSRAVDAAHDAGLVVAAAAGNAGPGTCTVGSPGAAPNALTVGSMADLEQNGFYQADSSSRGPTADGRVKPDVSAPGVRVTSALANSGSLHVSLSGTSMATPFVAGVTLLMRDADPSLSPQQVKDRIMRTAVDWGRGDRNQTPGTTGADIDYGAGRLDAYAALEAAGAGLTSPPPVPAHLLREGTLGGTGGSAEYSLPVSDTRFPIAATLVLPGVKSGRSSDPDFDLELYDPSGARVAAAETTDRQEELGHRPLVTGTYRLRVVSFRGSGQFFVDVSAGVGTPPDTSIAGSPPEVTPSSSATFAFTSSTAGSTFQCRLDSGAWSSCVSPTSYSNLSEGVHRFEVAATGPNGLADPTPASRSWTIDQTAPAATITAGPAGTTTSSDATFEFSSSEAPSTFECRLDAAAWESCSSPRTYRGLAEGPHAFEVRATDRAGNLGPPARRDWTRVAGTSPGARAAPEITIVGRPYARRSRRGRVTVHTRARVTCPAASPEPCGVSGRLRGRVRSARRARTVLLTLGRRSLRVAAGRSAVVNVRLSRRAAREIARKRRLRASLTVTAASGSAERAVLRRTITIRLRR